MDDLYSWGDVAQILRTRPRGTQSALAAYLGMDPSYLSRMLKDGAGELTVAQARAITNFLEGRPAESESRLVAGSSRRLPVYGYAAASDGDRFVLNEGDILDEIELPMGIVLGPGEYFVVLPAGSSMEPRIFAGEPQVVRRNYPPGRDKKAVIEFRDGTAVIKNYRGLRTARSLPNSSTHPRCSAMTPLA